MTDRPTTNAQFTFEARLASAFAAYADRAPIDVDAVTLTAAVATGPALHRSPLGGARRYLVPVLLGLLLVAIAAGVALVGSRLLHRRPDADTPPQPAIVAPSSDPSPGPVAEPSVQPTRQPDPSERPPADQPCATMLDLLFPYVPLEHPTDPIPAVGPVTGNGDVLVRTVTDAPGIGRFDPSQSPPSPVEPSDGVELPFQSAGFISGIDPKARMVVSPDGRALAVEAGDFGQAGCGDPIVVPAVNAFGGTPASLRRPFPGRAFELISDLAWAPDGSALYAIRRPTLDALGQPYTANVAPGTVLRWDSATAEVTELPSGCEACSRLFVSPDGRHLAAESEGVVKLIDVDRHTVQDAAAPALAGGWRELISEQGVLGWADDRSLVLRGGRVNLDGGWAAWPGAMRDALDEGDPILSPDGTTVAVMTGSDDLKHKDVTLYDVREESPRVIWSALITADCESAVLSDRQACLNGLYGTPHSETVTDVAGIAAWAPDGSALMLADGLREHEDSTTVRLRVVSVDGSGAGSRVTVEVPESPSIVWLPATAP